MAKPLYLPEGSVRALLVLMVTWTACWLVSSEVKVPPELWGLVQMGIGFYTGMKVAQKNGGTP